MYQCLFSKQGKLFSEQLTNLPTQHDPTHTHRVYHAAGCCLKYIKKTKTAGACAGSRKKEREKEKWSRHSWRSHRRMQWSPWYETSPLWAPPFPLPSSMRTLLARHKPLDSHCQKTTETRGCRGNVKVHFWNPPKSHFNTPYHLICRL